MLPEVSQAVAAFTMAMKELNLSEQVTLFTASDFGRTLALQRSRLRPRLGRKPLRRRWRRQRRSLFMGNTPSLKLKEHH